MINNKFFIALFCLTNLIVSSFAWAQQSLFVAIGWDKPPYVMSNARAGFEVEMLRDIMQNIGYEVQFIQIPYGRSYDIFNMNNIDAVATLSSKRQAKQVHLSDAYIQYQNVVVTLASSNIVLDSVEDMSNVSTVGFQSAFKLLGSEFTKMATDNAAYREIPDQGRQVKLLFSKKTQAIVLDVNIFNHLSRTIINTADEQPVIIHQLFAPSLYRVGFRDPEIQVKFDQALSAYLTSEKYATLSKKYHFYNALIATENSSTLPFTE
ncbi:MAG: transporter substrate-binding domain-containing protein [Aliiglaciecola sp.]|uniref:substrate-binding periplasmic protein n=1 Tax=Aliiglaciecola sp. TaxID=1872441 RepID=UPI00329929E9